MVDRLAANHSHHARPYLVGRFKWDDGETVWLGFDEFDGVLHRVGVGERRCHVAGDPTVIGDFGQALNVVHDRASQQQPLGPQLNRAGVGGLAVTHARNVARC